MVRTQQYKMIFDENRSRGELYDLLLDPEENQNLIDARGKTIGRISEYATLKEAMRGTIEKYRAAEPDNAERELSPAMIEDLRALGYAE